MVCIWHVQDYRLLARGTQAGTGEDRQPTGRQRGGAAARGSGANHRRRSDAGAQGATVPRLRTVDRGRRRRRVARLRRVIVLDTGGVYAALDANEALHPRAVAALLTSPPP